MISYSENAGDGGAILQRRDFKLGFVSVAESSAALLDMDAMREGWQGDRTVYLPQYFADRLEGAAASISQSHQLMSEILAGRTLEEIFDQPLYLQSLEPEFTMISAVIEEHDEQGIEKLFFDGNDGEALVEDLWCKASWLSFCDGDASMRFRFSFGMEGYEDVAADPYRQMWAAKLTDALFPESKIVTEHAELQRLLACAMAADSVSFAEKIVYFNAPNGGAQMHHDVEPGHAGVIFVQLSGETFWLSLAKPLLIDALVDFCLDNKRSEAIAAVLPEQEDRDGLMALIHNRQALADYMDQYDHEWVEAVLDRSPDFVAYLIALGHGYRLRAGDGLLIPQRDLQHCVWHSVFCLGDTPGEGLSFAIKAHHGEG
ncbi:MAG: hypothetical protein HQM07_08175 [Zetaproteobacteria bacterium]|nr:hypothetical protein [Zetaproteobacteria bacterium]